MSESKARTLRNVAIVVAAILSMFVVARLSRAYFSQLSPGQNDGMSIQRYFWFGFVCGGGAVALCLAAFGPQEDSWVKQWEDRKWVRNHTREEVERQMMAEARTLYLAAAPDTEEARANYRAMVPDRESEAESDERSQ